MARLAFVAQARSEAIVLPPDPVTVVAARRGALQDAFDVTRGARDVQVLSFEREESRLVEGSGRGLPAMVHRVAGLAARAQGALVRVSMARRACRSHSGKLDRDASAGRKDPLTLLMTALTGQGGVRAAEKRGGRLVRVAVHGEGRRRMAGLAAGPELAQVDVRVARAALGRNAFEANGRVRFQTGTFPLRSCDTWHRRPFRVCR